MSPQGRWRILIAASSLLALGAVGGVTADRLIELRPHIAVIRLGDVQRDPLGSLDRVLELQPEQRKRVAAILESHQRGIDAIWRDTHVKLRTAVDSVVNEIAGALSPEQARQFRVLANELHRGGTVRVHRRP